MQEYRIPGTKYSIACVNEFIDRGKSILDLSSIKKRMRLQLVGYVKSDDTVARSGAIDIKKYKQLAILQGDYEYWVLLYSGQGRAERGVVREGLALPVACFYRTLLTTTHLDIAEELVIALGDENLLQDFRKTFGVLPMLALQNDFWKTFENSYNPSKSGIITTKYYSRGRRYSVRDLLSDLEEDKSSIMTDPSLIGQYTKISGSSSAVGDGVRLIDAGWFKIFGILGNKTRANLSIQYRGQVSINIPPNTYGEEDGDRIFGYVRTMCIILDGTLHQSIIAVKVSPTLGRKLRRIPGLVLVELLRKDELLLDLTQIPIVGVQNFERLTKNTIGKALIDIHLLKIAVEFYKLYLPKTGSSARSDGECYLAGLGVRDGLYTNPSPEPKKKGTSTRVYELEAKIGLGSEINAPTKRKSELLRYKDQGWTSSHYLSGLLGSIPIPSTPEEAETLCNEYKTLQWKAIRRYRDIVFQLVMSKGMILTGEKYKPNLGNYFKCKHFKCEYQVGWDLLENIIYVRNN